MNQATCHIHGFFLVIENLGVLITAPANSGKSELGLELVSRGHRFIADDCVKLMRNTNNIVGTCPKLLKNHIAIRDIGILDIRTLFSNKAILECHKLDVILNLQNNPKHIDKTHMKIEKKDVLGINIDLINLALGETRNYPFIIEILIRQYNMIKKGYDSHLIFCKKQQMKIDMRTLCS